MFCPPAKLFKVLVDAAVGSEQRPVSATASLQAPEVVLFDEVVRFRAQIEERYEALRTRIVGV